jgi:hypothetical protein
VFGIHALGIPAVFVVVLMDCAAKVLQIVVSYVDSLAFVDELVSRLLA